MACEYCRGDKWLSECDDKFSYKGDFYPGIDIFIDDDGVLDITVVPDTYEPCYMEKRIKINFCPMCGQKLSEGGEINERKD